MERKRVEEFEESLMWRLWMNQSCITLGFLSQNSLWKLSFFCGYKGYLYWGENGMWRVKFFQNRASSRLGLAAWLSCEIQPRDNRTANSLILSCTALASMMLQLLACLTRVHLLEAYSRESLWDPVASLCFLAHSWAFQHSISLTTLATIPPKYRVTKYWNTSKFDTE